MTISQIRVTSGKVVLWNSVDQMGFGHFRTKGTLMDNLTYRSQNPRGG